MEAEDQGPDLRAYLQIARRRKWLMFATSLTVVVTAVLASLRMTPVYEAATRIELQPVSGSGSDETKLIEMLVDRGRTLQTQVELMRSDEVLKRAAKSLELGGSKGLQRAMEVELINETQIAEVRVRHVEPEAARDWANSVTTAYIDFRQDRALDALTFAAEKISTRIEETKAKIAEQDRVLGDVEGEVSRLRKERDRLNAELATLQAQASAPPPTPGPPDSSLLKRIERTKLQISGLDQKIADYEGGGTSPESERDSLVARLGTLEAQRDSLPDAEELRRGGGTVVAPATTPAQPVSPNLVRNIALAVALGLALAVGVAFLAEQLDDRIREPEEVERRVGAPILGYVPYVKGWGEHSTVAAIEQPSSGAAEAYRTLRTNLSFLSLEKPLRTLVVTSAVAEEGKSTTAANLSVVFAQAGRPTVLASGDLRRPSVHKLFGLRSDRGLVDALDPAFPVSAALSSNGVENLHILPDGPLPPNPTEILASPRFGDLLRTLTVGDNLVLIDSPPVLGLADTSVLASRVDGVLMVVDTNQVTRRALSHAVDQINKAGGKILGTVINAVEPQQGYGYYYQYYYYRYTQDGEAGRRAESSREPATQIPDSEWAGHLSSDNDDVL